MIRMHEGNMVLARTNNYARWPRHVDSQIWKMPKTKMDFLLWAVKLGELRYNNHLMGTIFKNWELYGWKNHRIERHTYSKSNDVSSVGAHGKSIPYKKRWISQQRCRCNIRKWLWVAAKYSLRLIIICWFSWKICLKKILWFAKKGCLSINDKSKVCTKRTL